MRRDLILATFLSSVWISMCFLAFGALYTSVPKLIGWSQFSAFENALGQIDVHPGTNITWVSLIVYAVAMFVASAPINYYWTKRLEAQADQA